VGYRKPKAAGEFFLELADEGALSHTAGAADDEELDLLRRGGFGASRQGPTEHCEGTERCRTVRDVLESFGECRFCLCLSEKSF